MKTALNSLLSILFVAMLFSLPAYGGDGASAGGFFGGLFHGEYGLDNPKYDEETRSSGEIIFSNDEAFYDVLIHDIKNIELNNGEIIEIKDVTTYYSLHELLPVQFESITIRDVVMFETDSGKLFSQYQIVSVELVSTELEDGE